MVDRHARIIDDVVNDAEWIGLWHPTEIVDRLRPVALPASVDFVDCADLARLWFRKQIFVVETPPRRRITPERFASVCRISARPRLYVHDPNFQDVTGLRAADCDRTGANVHAVAFTGSALAVHRSGAAAIDALLVLGPQIDALDAGIALDHAFDVITGVMRYGFDGDIIT